MKECRRREGMNLNRTYGLGICPYMVRWWDIQLVQRRWNNWKSGGIKNRLKRQFLLRGKGLIDLPPPLTPLVPQTLQLLRWSHATLLGKSTEQFGKAFPNSVISCINANGASQTMRYIAPYRFWKNSACTCWVEGYFEDDFVVYCLASERK